MPGLENDDVPEESNESHEPQQIPHSLQGTITLGVFCLLHFSIENATNATLTVLAIMCSHEENSSAGGQQRSTCFAKQQYLNLKREQSDSNTYSDGDLTLAESSTKHCQTPCLAIEVKQVPR